MKKRLSLLVCTIMILSCFCNFPSPAFAAGSGTDNDPYIIKTAKDFENIENDPSAVYLLTKDIVLPDSYAPFEFSGKLIGEDAYNLNSITVSVNVPSSTTESPAGGLFTKISGLVEIKNIRLKGSVIGGTEVGGFIGGVGTITAGSIIENCINEAEVKATGNYVGGIIARVVTANLKLVNVANYGNITGKTSLGGIASCAAYIDMGRNFGNVTGTGGGYIAGGLTGSLYGTITNSYNAGNVTQGYAVGGITGSYSGNRSITNCYNSGTITGTTMKDDNDVGGIVGTATQYTLTMTNCYNIGVANSMGNLFNPVFPSHTSVKPEGDSIKAENCYYFSETGEDDGKEGTNVQTPTDRAVIDAAIKNITEVIDKIKEFENPNWQSEAISVINNSLILFVGSSNAFKTTGNPAEAQKMKIDSNNTDVRPIVKEGRTLVPARFIAESLGAEVSWDDPTQTVTVNRNGTVITLKINSDIMKVGSQEVKIDVPAQLVNSRTLVPLRSISEALEKKVYWDDMGMIIINDNASAPSAKLIEQASQVWLTSISEVEARVKIAAPGDDILIKNGVYESIKLELNGRGEENMPVVIRAQSPGQVVFTTDVNIVITGKYVEFHDFKLEHIRVSGTAQEAIQLKRAEYCRVSGCYFYDVFGLNNPNANAVSIKDASSYNRVDHNVFEYSEGLFVTTSGGLDLYNLYNTIDSNYFKDTPSGAEIYNSANSLEPIGAFSVAAYAPYQSFLTVENNLFENCIGDNSEVVCNKSTSNIYRYNTFINSSEPSFRGGLNNVFDGNFVINCKSGLRAQGNGNVVTNNYIFNPLRGMQFRTADGHALKTWGPTYGTSEDVVIANNTIIYPMSYGMSLGEYYSPSIKYMHSPSNVALVNNLVITDSVDAYSIINVSDSRIENNIASVSGSGTIGTKTEGIIEKNIDLVFDGQLYVPANWQDLENQGVYVKEVEEHSQEKGLEDGIDIGVNKLFTSAARKGFLTADDVGPEDRWWVSQLKKEPTGAFDFMEKNTLDLKRGAVYLTVGEVYNLHANIRKYFDMGKSSNPLFEDIGYSVKSGGEFITLDGANLTASDAGIGSVTVQYGDQTKEIKVYAVSSGVQDTGGVIYSNEFENAGHRISMESVGSDNWQIVDGTLTNKGKAAASTGYIVDHTANLSGDYTISCDMTLDNFGEGYLQGLIMLGYADHPNTHYIQVRLSDSYPETQTSGIYSMRSNIDTQIGQINKSFEKNKTYKIEVQKAGNRIFVRADGEIIGAANIDADTNGKIAFGSNNIVTVDNVSVSKTSGVIAEAKEMQVSAKRTDAEEVTFNFGRINENENSLYRIYRNGIWIADRNLPEYVNISTRPDREYNYTFEEINASGAVIGRGSIKFTCPSAPSQDFFMITNPLTKSEVDENFKPGAYLSGNLRIVNKGLKVGDFKHVDSAYKFDRAFFDMFPIFKQFEGAAFAGVSNADRLNPLFFDENCDDYYKFDINKPATVYYLAYYSKNIIDLGDRSTKWSRENGWEVINLSDTPITENTLYMKHYDVPEGETVTVKVGGLKSSVSITGQIFIVPDKK